MGVCGTERFWSKVDRSGGPNACWLWTASLDHHGYGRFGVGGRGEGWTGAHRYAYELLVGPIPESRELDHRRTCPKRCINPAHLRPRTHKQNIENRSGLNQNNTSGVRRVHWATRERRWVGRVKHNGHEHCVGYFRTIEEAEAAVIAKRNELFTNNDADRT